MAKDINEDFLDAFLMNLWWGIESGGLSMFYSLQNLFSWIINAFFNAFLWL